MRGGGQNSDSNDTAILWLPATLIVLSVVIWYFFHEQISHFFIIIKMLELKVMVALIRPVAQLLQLLHLPSPDVQKMLAVEYTVSGSNLATISPASLIDLSEYVGSFFRFPVIFLLMIMAGFLFFSPVAQRFKNIYSMASFRDAEHENWPQITPVKSINLLKTDIEKGPWAMAQRPIDFCLENELVDEKARAERGELVISYGSAFKVFALQLGSPWRGIRNCPIHVRALYAAFLAYASYEREEAIALLNQISVSATHSGKLNFSGIDQIIKKYETQPMVAWLERQHAYVGTLMMSLLKMARLSGVVACAEFLWLKPVDRRLWFTLNSVGRQTAVVEVAGVQAHWLAEKKVGRALKTPMVKQAIVGLEEALGQIKFTSDEDRWRDSVA